MSEGGGKRFVQKLSERIRSFFSTMDQAHRDKVTELTEFEQKELENTFVLLLVGSFTGIPAPPSFISAELLPYLEREIKVLNSRAERSSDSLAETVGILDID